MNQFDLQGKRAVVTGGARGIARAIAERLFASGAEVMVWDLRTPEPPTTAFHSLIVDVADEAQVNVAAAETLKKLGGIDILINGAGVTGPTGPTETYGFQQWRRVVAINLDSVFLVSKAFIPSMKAAKYGRIISIASVAGKEGNPGMTAYTAAKAGVIAMTKAMGRELANTGILVNCVTPALVQTELLKEMSPEAIELSRGKIPLGRFGTVEEVAAMVAWMASSECGFTTGSAFDLSGGRSSF
ncbi:MAG: SDR family oxidoreductase [Alphaproteobacteria bacterium]|nr:SDR family oxidoreductase [Alphaproteobacteria bacterium]